MHLQGVNGLQLAVHRGHARCVETLIRHGADVFAPLPAVPCAECPFFTVVMVLAAQHGHADVVRLLARHEDELFDFKVSGQSMVLYGQ